MPEIKLTQEQKDQLLAAYRKYAGKPSLLKRAGKEGIYRALAADFKIDRRTAKRQVDLAIADERQRIKYRNIFNLQEDGKIDFALWAEKLMENINDALYGTKELSKSQQWMTKLLIEAIDRKQEEKSGGGADGDEVEFPV
jgi:hypothetical protein